MHKCSKIAFLIIGFILAVAFNATAQGSYVFYAGATHRFTVSGDVLTFTDWKIYTDGQMSTEATASEASMNQLSVTSSDITISKEGTYFLVVKGEGMNGCTNTKAIVVIVQPNTTSIAFNPKEAGDCADPNTPTSNTTATVELFAADGVPLPNANYPVTVDYKVTKPDGTTKTLTHTLQDPTDYSLPLNGLVNDVSQDQVYDVVLVKATDKYGMEIHVSTTAGTFQYTIFKTPVTPVIQIN